MKDTVTRLLQGERKWNRKISDVGTDVYTGSYVMDKCTDEEKVTHTRNSYLCTLSEDNSPRPGHVKKEVVPH